MRPKIGDRKEEDGKRDLGKLANGLFPNYRPFHEAPYRRHKSELHRRSVFWQIWQIQRPLLCM